MLSDLSLSQELIAKLDAEKGISNNGLLAQGEQQEAEIKEEKEEPKDEKADDVKEAEIKGEEDGEAQKPDSKEINGSEDVKGDVKMEEVAPAEDVKAGAEGKESRS